VIEQGLRVTVGNVALLVLRRDAQSRALSANDRRHRVDHFEQEARAVLD
jgi:hypothetical protein